MKGELPVAVGRYLQEHLTRDFYAAFVAVGPDGNVLEVGGDLERYGIGDLEVAVPVVRQASFLEGLLPLGGDTLVISDIQTRPGLYADIHLFPGKGKDWVLLLDCTENASARQQLQQRGNELALLRELHSRILDAHGVLVLLRRCRSRFLLETSPEWLHSILPGAEVGSEVDVIERFPFLETFMDEAEVAWSGGAAGLVRSGIWVEQSEHGVEMPLEAAAMRHEEFRILLLWIPLAEYREKQEILTKARESRLEHDRLHKEIQKKEILLHCIIHDLAGPLSGIKGALSLLGRLVEGAEMQRYLEICLRLSDDQERLIRSILATFSAELSSPDSHTLAPDQVPSAKWLVRGVRDSLRPSFTLRGVDLQVMVPELSDEDLRVAIDETSLQRMLLNLLDNALRHSRRDQTVTLAVERDSEAILFSVEDQGPGVPEEEVGGLFEKFGQGSGGRGAAGLGLYFCRITAERWGGEVGHRNREQGGSRFWFRLPAYVADE